MSMSRIRQLIHEIHRRSLWQVLGIYLVGSWVGYQVVLNLTQGVGLPHWVPGLAVALFVIGLPIVLATAFVQEGLPASTASRPARSDAAPFASPGVSDRAADAPPGDPADSSDAIEVSRRPAAAAAPPVERRASPAPDRGRHHWLLTWQRALLGGVVAFLLLGITAGGYMGARNAGIGPFGALIAAGKLEERERLLVADFGSGPADAELAEALTQAFRIDFSQSPVINVVEPRYAHDLLQRMGLEGSARLDATLAREAARRDGIKAIVTGDVARAGRGYVLSASLVTAEDGAVLAAFRENAADSAAVLDAVDRLSRRLRERIGESLRSVNRSAALPPVTTTSLEALKKYARAVQAVDVENDVAAGIALLEEAIGLDSTFGMAWRKLAVTYSNSGGGRDQVAHAATRAYELRDGMSLREREMAVAYYHSQVTGDLQAAIRAYQALLEVHPDDHAALNNVALLYSRSGDPERAVEYYRRAIEADSANPLSASNLVAAYLNTGRVEEAERQLVRYVATFGETPAAVRFAVHTSIARGDFDEAMASARRLAELRRGDPQLRAESENMLADIYVLHGRLARAWQHRQEALAAARERGQDWQPLQTEMWEAERDIFVRRDPDAAVRRLDRALVAHPMNEITPLNRPYGWVINYYAFAGRADLARFWLDEREREIPADQRIDGSLEERISQIALAWADGDLTTALRLIDRLEGVDACRRCAAYMRALVLDRMEDDGAIDAYERYLATPDAFRIYFDNVYHAGALERLAQLYAERGRSADAARHAGRFIELWNDADAELQPRVAAMRDLLRSLTPEG
jgi:tetratricopeptide (TPR) repeat protein